MKKLWTWFLASHRWQHLTLGMAVGLLPSGWYDTEVLACGVAGSLEFKDYKYQQGWDWIDFLLTVLGVNIGHGVRYLLFH